MVDPETIASLVHKLKSLELQMEHVEDRVSVIEEESCTNRNRLQDLERWQETIDDRLDDEL